MTRWRDCKLPGWAESPCGAWGGEYQCMGWGCTEHHTGWTQCQGTEFQLQRPAAQDMLLRPECWETVSKTISILGFKWREGQLCDRTQAALHKGNGSLQRERKTSAGMLARWLPPNSGWTWEAFSRYHHVGFFFPRIEQIPWEMSVCSLGEATLGHLCTEGPYPPVMTTNCGTLEAGGFLHAVWKRGFLM